MPQFDINFFLPVLYTICIIFNLSYVIFYITYFFQFINKKKSIFFYKLKIYLMIFNNLIILKNITNKKIKT